jgi:hypothetical protein
MKRRILVASVILAGVGLSITGFAGAPPSATPAKPVAAPPEAPMATSFAILLEGFKWGADHNELTKLHNQVNGVFDREYNPLLVKVQPGVKMQALESERETKKFNFAKSFVEFKDTPLGFDTTGLKGEYSYKNKEFAQILPTATKRRFFFYFGNPPGDKLWKIYDEVKLVEGGPLGKTYQEAVQKMNAQLSVAGKARNADPDHGHHLPYTDWQDATTHLRLIDRSGEHVVGVALEDKNIYRNLVALRPNKLEDPLAMDPSIQLATKGGVSDPNAKPAPGAAAADAGAPAKSAKKK